MTTQDTIMRTDAKHDQDWKYAEKALTWYGWGSPVGVGLFIVSVGAFLMLIHYAGIV